MSVGVSRKTVSLADVRVLSGTRSRSPPRATAGAWPPLRGTRASHPTPHLEPASRAALSARPNPTLAQPVPPGRVPHPWTHMRPRPSAIVARALRPPRPHLAGGGALLVR
eukprot:235962-Prymnesium_polylepis.1